MRLIIPYCLRHYTASWTQRDPQLMSCVNDHGSAEGEESRESLQQERNQSSRILRLEQEIEAKEREVDVMNS